jgi:hypothetical protein
MFSSKEITIPYIDKLLISKKMNPKYYSIVKGVGRKLYVENSRIHAKLSNNTYKVDDKNFILDENGEKIIANKRTVGKPRYWVVNFQDLYNGKVNKFGRNARMDLLKEAIWQAIKTKDSNQLIKINEYPIKIELFIYTEEMPVDVDNKGAIYHKAFQDLLTSLKIITDDSSSYINDTGRTKWIKSNLNQMKFRISKSDFYTEN